MIGALDKVGRVSPRTILLSALGAFLIYGWPGFIGWDTREHFLQSRAGYYQDGHPPAVAVFVRFCELFVAGPALPLLTQAVTLLLGLYLVLRSKLSPRAAALASSAVFLFPYVAGVTALISKDCLMAGTMMIGIGLMLDERTSRHRIAVGFLLFASMMRWNALAATFGPMILLFRWNPRLRGLRRYAVALAAWLVVTVAAFEINDVLTDEHEHQWYWAYAYSDIAGTLEYLPDIDDATLNQVFEGVPIREHDHLHARFHALYNPASHYHLMRNDGRIFEIPQNDAQRAAIWAAWKRMVLGNPGAYLRYRLDNFQQLIALDRPPAFSNVYIWFNVIDSPQVISELEHDAGPSRIQAVLRDWSVRISLTPLYYTFIYFAACFVIATLSRARLEIALMLSAFGYELQWFFLAATADLRYSQWMVVCLLTTIPLVGARLRARRRGG